ncbi:MAG TPA: DUF3102 domain-containing protein [Cellvibrio sp.]|nr:DUF3102 domain-containing protein [Cellvibrio sp.]
MARKKIEDPTVVIEHGEIAPAITQQLTETSAQMSEHSLHIMNTYGEGLPYDRSRVVHEARFYMAQSAEAMLEAGKRLVILKEHEPHGDFAHIIEEQLGLETRIAQKMMQAAVKFLSPRLESKAKSISHLGKTKLYELMLLDDEQIENLTEGGTIAGMDLDEIDRMSSRELRKALRDARENITTKSEVIAGKMEKIDELQTKLRKIRNVSPDAQLMQARKEVAALESEVEERIRVQLRSAFNQLQELADTTGSKDHTDFVASQLDLLDRALLQIRTELGIERSVKAGVEWEGHEQDAA